MKSFFYLFLGISFLFIYKQSQEYSDLKKEYHKFADKTFSIKRGKARLRFENKNSLSKKSVYDLLERLESLFLDGEPFDEMLDFYCENFTPIDFKRLYLVSEKAPYKPDLIEKIQLYCIARIGNNYPRLLIDHVTSDSDSSFITPTLVYSNWSRTEPAVAFQHYKENRDRIDPSERDSIRNEILINAIIHNPTKETINEFFEDSKYELSSTAYRLTNTIIDHSKREKILLELLNFSKNNETDSRLICKGFGKGLADLTNLYEGIELIEDLSLDFEKFKPDFIHGLLIQNIDDDMKERMDWVKSTLSSNEFQNILPEVFSEWSKIDKIAATNWLDKQTN